ncbi:MAG TPA: HAD-IA family hydrolase [Acidimicrobiales bacterium]
MIRSVMFDFGGVITDSPFDAFQRYEEAEGLPVGAIRSINATNPDTNAWAQLERGEVDMSEFFDLFEGEANAAGYRVDARVVMARLSGEVRPAMVEALRRCSERFKTACLTNNFVLDQNADLLPARPDVAEALALFDVVLESSKLGVRKPDPRFYEMACEIVGVTPDQVVYLDDLGINLKPARAMGMWTIKVTSPEMALEELSAILGMPLG